MYLLTALLVFFIIYGFVILLLALISRKIFESFVVASVCMAITISGVLFYHYVGKDYIPNDRTDWYSVTNVTRTTHEDKYLEPSGTQVKTP